MPEGLVEVLLWLGALSVVAGGVQFALTPLVKDRTRGNARALGLKKQAERWTPERAERMSRMGSLAFICLGFALVVGSIVVWIISLSVATPLG